MKIITCAGYYRTGSSAISDFFSEFENCKSLGDFEVRFLQDPDGISDLEYNLIENNHRHNTSHAIKRYKKLVNFLNGTWYAPRYRKYFGNMFMKCSLEYIDKITELQCKSWWHRDQIDRGSWFYFFDRVYAQFVGVFQKERFNISMLQNESAYFTHITKEEFYKYTRQYLQEIFNYANENDDDYMMIDQLVPPSNINRYLNYFDDIKVISVERDPRDLYVLEKVKYRWGIIPYKDVETFCEWYRITRTHRKYEKDDTNKVVRIYFEDLIYRYEETSNMLINFIGLKKENHTLKKEFFNPEISIKNTRVYLTYPELKADVEYIEKHLEEYLYGLPSKD
ncbi:MAG: hypothetical protein GX308_09730 [Epulopiscium sp.]|nr:hypothetical protein [Candidatus Epulonipiscium sp.]